MNNETPDAFMFDTYDLDRFNDELGKKYFDYTYNNINHPNNFGVSILAQAVLTAFGI